eukprot:5511425-Alexandrium_andersonii.AAC.1
MLLPCSGPCSGSFTTLSGPFGASRASGALPHGALPRCFRAPLVESPRTASPMGTWPRVQRAI